MEKGSRPKNGQPPESPASGALEQGTSLPTPWFQFARLPKGGRTANATGSKEEKVYLRERHHQVQQSEGARKGDVKGQSTRKPKLEKGKGETLKFVKNGRGVVIKGKNWWIGDRRSRMGVRRGRPERKKKKPLLFNRQGEVENGGKKTHGKKLCRAKRGIGRNFFRLGGSIKQPCPGAGGPGKKLEGEATQDG